jgi:hypothetical protein
MGPRRPGARPSATLQTSAYPNGLTLHVPIRNGPCIHSGTGGRSPVVTLLTAMCTTGLTSHILN